MVQIGTILKPQGLKGAIKISFEAFFLEWLESNEFTHLYISENGNKAPYFIESLNLNAIPPIIKLESVNDRSAAINLRYKEAFLEEKLFEGFLIEEEDDREWAFLKGFLLKDADEKEIGQIQEILLLPGHEIAEVNYKGKAVLVPLSEELILSLDEETKILVMELAEGVLDL